MYSLWIVIELAFLSFLILLFVTDRAAIWYTLALLEDQVKFYLLVKADSCEIIFDKCGVYGDGLTYLLFHVLLRKTALSSSETFDNEIVAHLRIYVVEKLAYNRLTLLCCVSKLVMDYVFVCSLVDSEKDVLDEILLHF